MKTLESFIEYLGADKGVTLPKDKISECISKIPELPVAEDSHFGPLGYHIASVNPFYHGKCEFCVEGSKVYLKKGLEKVYIGCDIEDPALSGIRFNIYSEYTQMLFDFYYDNGGYSVKTLCYAFPQNGKNTEIAEYIEKFRQLYCEGKHQQAQEYLDIAEFEIYTKGVLKNAKNIYRKPKFPPGTEVYVMDKNDVEYKARLSHTDTKETVKVDSGQSIKIEDALISLKRHPLKNSTAKTLAAVTLSVTIPFLKVKGLFYEKKTHKLLVKYRGSGTFPSPDLVDKIFKAVIEVAAPYIKDAVSIESCTNLPETDLYDVAAGAWLSDYDHKEAEKIEENVANDEVPRERDVRKAPEEKEIENPCVQEISTLNTPALQLPGETEKIKESIPSKPDAVQLGLFQLS